MSLSGVQFFGPVMNRAISTVTPSVFNPSKVLSAPAVVENGLLIAVTLVLGSAATSLEALEVFTGIIGALAVYVMKESTSRHQKCVDEPVVKPGRNCQPTMADGDIVCSMQGPEATKQSRLPQCAQEHAHSSACAHAELNRMRAEFELENWKLKVESDEAELTELQAEIANLEKDLVESSEVEIDSLLMTISEAKLRAEELETELAQSNAKKTELDKEVAQKSSIQLQAEEDAQTLIDARLADLMEANFQWTEEHMGIYESGELCEPFNVFGDVVRK